MLWREKEEKRSSDVYLITASRGIGTTHHDGEAFSTHPERKDLNRVGDEQRSVGNIVEGVVEELRSCPFHDQIFAEK